MSIFLPGFDPFHCATCGADKRAHHPESMACPVRARPDSLTVAQTALEKAEAGGDQAAIFVARGEVQRLTGREAKPTWSGDACHECGGLTTRTGTCYTCTSCGAQGGCG